MEVSTIQKQIKSKNPDNFYIFTGEEIAVQDVYIKKLAQCKEIELIRLNTVIDLMPKLNNRSFIKADKCYVIHNDMDFLKAETAWNQVINSVGNNILILIYDNIDKRGKFYKQFKDTIAVFDHMGEEVLIKHIKKHVDLSDKNCIKLINICEFDLSRILLEIDKIKQYKRSFEDESKN